MKFSKNPIIIAGVDRIISHLSHFQQNFVDATRIIKKKFNFLIKNFLKFSVIKDTYKMIFNNY